MLAITVVGVPDGVGTGVELDCALLAEAEVELVAEAVVWFAAELAIAVVVVAVELVENGFAPPEPQPTTEATAIAAAANFTNNLGLNCTL